MDVGDLSKVTPELLQEMVRIGTEGSYSFQPTCHPTVPSYNGEPDHLRILCDRWGGGEDLLSCGRIQINVCGLLVEVGSGFFFSPLLVNLSCDRWGGPLFF